MSIDPYHQKIKIPQVVYKHTFLGLPHNGITYPDTHNGAYTSDRFSTCRQELLYHAGIPQYDRLLAIYSYLFYNTSVAWLINSSPTG